MNASGPPTSLPDYLQSRRALIEQALERFLPRPPDCPAGVSEAMHYSVMAPGKRLRPILTVAAAEGVVVGGGRDISPREAAEVARARELAMPVACGIEFIHTYSLIHDDLPAMDDDVLRRGRPTLHVAHGEGVAILAGDGLLTEAFALMSREPAASSLASVDQRKLRVIRLVADAAGATGMVGGQALDLQAGGGLELDGPTLQAIHRRKTGALIRAAACGGAIMAGGSDLVVEAVGSYAASLGLAFQIVDDILDIEGAADELGKTAGKDAAAGKLTYPSVYGVKESRRLAAESIGRARQSLLRAGVRYRWLLELADWVGARRS